MTSELLRLARSMRSRQELPKFNPRPPGVIRDGSATDAVLKVLRAHPARFFTAGQLIVLTGRSHAAVSWALIYLRRNRLVNVTGDGARQSNYLRYQAIKETKHGKPV